MIEIWYEHRGQRPRKTRMIREDANKASVLPPSFEVVGVKYKSNQIGLKVEPPSDNISTDAVNAIATAFEDNWGGSVSHVETIVIE